MATAASRTTNPLLLALILTVACCVVAARRTEAPWALGFRYYVWLGAAVVMARVVFRVVFGGGYGEHVLFALPQIPLPQWAAGIRLLGPVAAEQLLGGFYDGLRLATMLVCLGAANALANPKRLLKAVPGALYEVGTTVVVALSVAPQLVESVQRVHRAQGLRGGARRGLRGLRSLLMPVLQDALERSLKLAAAMDSRGYGRRGVAGRRLRAATGVLVIGGLVGVCIGVYGLLGTTNRYLGAPMLAAGLLIAAVGFALGGRLVQRTVYRPDPWRGSELLVVAAGVAPPAGMFLTGATVAHPSLAPLSWPQLAAIPAAAILLAVLAAFLAPPPARSSHP